MVWLPASDATAQRTPNRGQPATERPQKEPEFRTEILKVRDGVRLRSFYFPADAEDGKKVIPVLVIHEWQGQASPYYKLYLALQKAGCAVFVMDYRGHGGSAEYVDRRGTKKQFNVAQMSRRDIMNIINLDIETAKAFLKRENNAGNLNLNALVVVGIGEGAVMAARWAQRDWSFPSVGTKKQGQDVKALVYISPEKQVKGIAIEPTLKDPFLIRLPIMIVTGNSGSSAAEAKRIGKRIEAMKRRLGGGTVSRFEMKTVNTTLSGPALVNDVSAVIPAITKFITSQVPVSDEVNTWVRRQ